MENNNDIVTEIETKNDNIVEKIKEKSKKLNINKNNILAPKNLNKKKA